MKAIKMLIIYVACICPIMFTSLMLIASGTVSLSYSGFGVDSAGILYLGTDAGIKKYDDGELIGSINPQTSRGYIFTIQKDDTILLSTASRIYKLDRSGNILDQQEDIGTSTFNELQKTKKHFVAQNGCEYVMQSSLGRVIICSDDEIIYQMPILDYTVKIAFSLAFVSVFVFVPIIIKKSRTYGF